MDTSPEYIKMCEKAEEIQKGHSIKKFDLFQDKNSGDIFSYDDNMLRKYIGTWIWLPRQDQLEAMADWDFNLSKRKESVRAGYSWAIYKDGYGYGMFNDADSFEKVLLIMIMKEKFNKTWNGEEWV